MESGAFGCVTNPGEAGKSHRKRIFALAGEVRSWMNEGSGIRVRRPPEAGSCKPTNRTWQAG
jgi:hypothetical protein